MKQKNKEKVFFLFFRDEWKTPFSPRDLKAFSVHPLFIFPTHYTGKIKHSTGESVKIRNVFAIVDW